MVSPAYGVWMHIFVMGFCVDHPYFCHKYFPCVFSFSACLSIMVFVCRCVPCCLLRSCILICFDLYFTFYFCLSSSLYLLLLFLSSSILGWFVLDHCLDLFYVFFIHDLLSISDCGHVLRVDC